MNFPNYIHEPIGQIDKESGMVHLTPAWSLVMQQMMTNLANNFGKNGVMVPSKPTADIAALSSPQGKGTFLYDAETDEAKVNINGVFKVIQTV